MYLCSCTGAQGVWKEAYHFQSLIQSQVKATAVSFLLLTTILSIYCWKCKENAEAEMKIAVKM